MFKTQNKRYNLNEQSIIHMNINNNTPQIKRLR